MSEDLRKMVAEGVPLTKAQQIEYCYIEHRTLQEKYTRAMRFLDNRRKSELRRRKVETK